MPLILQYAVIAVAVVLAALFVWRTRFPRSWRATRIAIAIPMLRDSIDAFMRHDVALARNVIAREESVDLLKRQINAHLIGSGGVTDAVRRQYIDHMTKLILGGLLTDKDGKPPG